MTIVHCKRESYDIYIGRPTLLGNPYRINQFMTRERSIELFETYARARIDTDSQFKQAILATHGKRLGCWCSPLACHGDIIEKLALALVNNLPYTE